MSAPKMHPQYGMIASIINNGEQVKGSTYDTSRYYNPAAAKIKEKIISMVGASCGVEE